MLADAEPLVPLTTNEVSEVRGLVPVRRGPGPQPFVRRDAPLGPCPPGSRSPRSTRARTGRPTCSASTSATSSSSAGPSGSAASAARPPAPSSPDQFALEWDQTRGAGAAGRAGSPSARDCSPRIGRSRVSFRAAARVAVVVDRERFDGVRALSCARATGAPGRCRSRLVLAREDPFELGPRAPAELVEGSFVEEHPVREGERVADPPLELAPVAVEELLEAPAVVRSGCGSASGRTASRASDRCRARTGHRSGGGRPSPRCPTGTRPRASGSRSASGARAGPRCPRRASRAPPRRSRATFGVVEGKAASSGLVPDEVPHLQGREAHRAARPSTSSSLPEPGMPTVTMSFMAGPAARRSCSAGPPRPQRRGAATVLLGDHLQPVRALAELRPPPAPRAGRPR